MKNDFFKIIRPRILREPDRFSDQLFWIKFESEFVTPTSSKRLERRVGWSAAIGVFALSIGALVINKNLTEPNSTNLSEIGLYGSIQQYPGLLDNLELFEKLESVALTDQDWEVLLEHPESS